MRFYANLRVTFLNRHLVDSGIHPLLFYPIAAFSFTGCSLLFFNRIDSAQYWYMCIPLFLIQMSTLKHQDDFLKSIYAKSLFFKLRSIEGILISFPFSLFLLYKEAYWMAIMLFFLSIAFSLFRVNREVIAIIPTPFGRFPFEFTRGFRKTYLIITIAYAVGIIGLAAGNFYLSLFGLAVLFLNCCSFYSTPEPPYFVWVFSMTPQQFIWTKIKTALMYTSLLCMPLMILVSIFNVDNLLVILLVQVIGLLLVVTSLLGKHSQYPSELNLIQEMSMGVSVIFPPLLLLIIPIFYFKSIKRLSEILT